MQKLRILISVLLLLVIGATVTAQDAPAAVREAGVTAIREAAGFSENPTNWVYSLETHSNTNLGCPIVSGTATSADIVVYNFTFTFPSGQYQVRVSGDTSQTVVCDSQLVTADTTTTTDDTSSTTTTTSSGALCTFTPNASGNAVNPTTGAVAFGISAGQAYTVFNSSSGPGGGVKVISPAGIFGWIQNPDGTFSDGCSLVLAQSPDTPGLDTVCLAIMNQNSIAVNSPTIQTIVFPVDGLDAFTVVASTESGGQTWYQITTYGATPNAWVPESILSVSSGCATILNQTTTDATTTTTGQCVITPNGGFSNVRSVPNSDNPDTIVGQITSPTPVLGRNAANTWYRINAGWVAMFVVQSSGNCNNLALYAEDNTNPPQTTTEQQPTPEPEEEQSILVNDVTEPYCLLTASSNVPLLAEPVQGAAPLTNITVNNTYVVLQERRTDIGSWYRVVDQQNGNVGWVSQANGFISNECGAFLADGVAVFGAENLCYAVINRDIAVFDGFTSGAQLVFNLVSGDRIAVLSSFNDGLSTSYEVSRFDANGRTGFVSASDATLSAGCANQLQPPAPTEPQNLADGLPPYCVVTANNATVTRTFNPTDVVADVEAGQRLLVIGVTQSNEGAVYRVMLPGGTATWINQTQVDVSDGCGIFLAQAPGTIGENLQCYGIVNVAGRAITEVTGSEGAFNINAGDRYAVIWQTQSDTGAWYAVTTFGLTPDGWVNQANIGVSPGCEFALAQAPMPAPQAQCVVSPRAGFTNVRSTTNTDNDNTIVGQIYQPTAATGRNSAGNWIQIENQFWIAGFVLNQEGDCGNLPIVAGF